MGRQLEADLNLLEEETTRRLEESIRKNVEEKLNSEEVQSEIERRIKEGQKKLFDNVVAQLHKEKEAALAEERRKEAQARKEREELDMMLKENSRRVEESQRREALEQQKKDEERFCELELIKRQKEEVAWRKKLEVEEDHANQKNLLAILCTVLMKSDWMRIEYEVSSLKLLPLGPTSNVSSYKELVK
ncbi:hypothetical protein DKX38_028926 [Salix brachista]|uniref:Uncharacterized protein n=1 Tax=Salix brachista TaxID=2182728 RepID=A0A5N5IXT5_9ROSI|nr:hypothetical protein DKX38_028926 [Salix brachista]